jgi:PAS domain S-box-containing protein
MLWQEATITIAPFVLAVVTSTALALYILVWYRHVSGTMVSALHLLVMAEWALADTAELISVNPTTKLLWDKIKLSGIFLMGPLWLTFVLQHLGKQKSLTRRNLALLYTPPLVAMLLTFTNESHGLMWHRPVSYPDRSFSLPEIDYGVGVLVYVVYASIVTLLATLALIHVRVRSHSLFRRQINSLLAVTYLPWLGLAVHLVGWKPYPQFYPVPFALIAGGIIGARNIFGLRAGDIVPVAREVAIEGMDDAVIVVDARNRIVDLNPAGRRVIGPSASKAIGEPIGQMWPDWPALPAFFHNQGDRDGASQEMRRTWESGRRVYDVNVSPLLDTRSQLIGQIIVLHDITELRAVDAELRNAYDELESRVQRRTRELTNANVVLEAEIADRTQAEAELAEQARELSRSNALITALSQVAARVEAGAAPDEIMHTLGTELKRLGATCMIALLEPDARALIISYTSLDTPLLAAAENLLGLKMIGYAIAPERLPIWDELIVQGRPVFVADSLSMMSASLPPPLGPLAKTLFQMAGEKFITPVIWLPLTTGTRVIGGLGMWGADLKEDDLPALSIFSSQVGVALEVAQLYKAERQRTAELVDARERLETELTERQRAEAQVVASLREKEVLLKEIHHRVKNNLQVISSLLSLQARHVQDQQVIGVLQESRQRIRSMALVHEKLYQSQDLTRIDFAEYLRSLASYLLRSYELTPRLVSLEVAADDVFLGIDTAIPCGLLVSELISNALKHAFPDGRGGKVLVAIRSGEDGRLTLTVSDDGIGFPEDLDLGNTRSLGLQLVNTLVSQINGTIDLDRDGGTTFRVTFVEPE